MQNIREDNPALFGNNGKQMTRIILPSPGNGQTLSSNQKFAETLYTFLKKS